MLPTILKYRNKELTEDDIIFIREIINQHYQKGRTRISSILCQAWKWVQPNGKLKDLAARDLLLRLEEKELISLPPRMRNNNNRKKRSFDQIIFSSWVPVFLQFQQLQIHQPLLRSSLHDLPKT